ncbi:MAG: phosphoribosylamine--glycine ligase [Lactobacillus sp.]|jgi:phosphoribosylamine--glycine ligase|nr:phosphoribosylamine--glycine ligase [Lactobacillus sp.]
MATVLVIGSGGREHAISQQFQKSPQVDTVYCAPGNPGMSLDGIQIVGISENDFDSLIQFAQDKQVDLTFVGPEVPLSKGIVDAFTQANLAVFGPKQASARLEGSKSFAKDFMKRHHIPTAQSETFTQLQPALAYVTQQEAPIVIKVDGLAAGKGVTIAQTVAEAQSVLRALYAHDAQQVVVIEDYLVGQEFSCMSFINGDLIVPLPLSQDHKRLLDGDKGPNTGGMGAYSPLPQMPADLSQQAYDQIVIPTIQGMVADGLAFSGILYAGLILTDAGIKVIEYNMRLGDPETQVLLPRLQSDFYTLITDLLAKRQPEVTWRQGDYTLGVVVGASGYPKQPIKGIVLPDLQNLPAAIQVTYAGVEEVGGHLVSAGGRVFMLTTTQASIKACQAVLYPALTENVAEPFIYRHDIGSKAL